MTTILTNSISRSGGQKEFNALMDIAYIIRDGLESVNDERAMQAYHLLDRLIDARESHHLT